jgi:hypothetical protein
MSQQVYTGADAPQWAQVLVADLNAALADLQKKITALEARIKILEAA